MDRFRQFLIANQWKGTHVRSQMKKFALLERRMGGSFSSTVRNLRREWNAEESRFWVRDRRIRRVIRDYGQEDQRTDAWHAKRSEMITASEVGNVIDGTPASRYEVMMRKLVTQVREERKGSVMNNPLLWGTHFEPIAKRIYERDTGCTIRDVSCVQHPTVPYLGASPDGIIISPSDRERHHCLVEFKCPISRKIGGEVPKSYWHQMQLQMLCTGVDECEYVEFQFAKVYYSEWMDFKGTKGIFAVYDDGRVEEWQAPGAIEDGELMYWVLRGVHRDLVTQDRDWLVKYGDSLRIFWEEVVAHRAAGTTPPKPGVLKLEL